MKDRGLIFTAESVRAILENRKTQIRRAVSRGNTYFNGASWPKWLKDSKCDWAAAYADDGPSPAGNPGPYLHLPYVHPWDDTSDEGDRVTARVYPKWQVGDGLYCREAWAPHFDYHPDEAPPIYRADEGWDNFEGIKWRSPMFMPRAAARIWLDICEVRVQRVGEISEADAVAEGCAAYHHSHSWWQGYDPHRDCTIETGNADNPPPSWMENPRRRTHEDSESAVEVYRRLWNRINGKKPGCSFEANPWVFAITFRRVEKDQGDERA